MNKEFPSRPNRQRTGSGLPHSFYALLLFLPIAFLAGCASWTQGSALRPAPPAPTAAASDQATTPPPWLGVHFLSPGHTGLPFVRRAIEEQLAPMGVNVIVYEVNYGFEFRSHPELRGGDPLTIEDARELTAVCRAHNIRLIPMFNCLGHQSWAKSTFPLLTKYRQFDETPNIPLDNPGIYCRSWCPRHPRVNKVVFALMDELIDAFQADAFHAGMDEVFLIANEQCPRCRGANPAEIFAAAVNDYHKHLVEKRGLTMLMWGDRLLDARAMGYSEWEASDNGTAPAIDLIPKDIIMCDWHYGLARDYPSVAFFQQKGFRVWPSSWKDASATRALIACSQRDASPRMLGHLFTTWHSASEVSRAFLGEASWLDVEIGAIRVARTIRMGMRLMQQEPPPLRPAAAR